jgi:16S rRNA C1402 (ribose-2'-O) methylase RsmI
MQIDLGASKVEIILDAASFLPAATHLFKGFYGVADAWEGASQAQLLQGAVLAIKYDVPTQLKAALNKLGNHLHDKEALELFWTLPGTWEPPFHRFIGDAIKHKLACR